MNEHGPLAMWLLIAACALVVIGVGCVRMIHDGLSAVPALLVAAGILVVALVIVALKRRPGD